MWILMIVSIVIAIIGVVFFIKDGELWSFLLVLVGVAGFAVVVITNSSRNNKEYEQQYEQQCHAIGGVISEYSDLVCLNEDHIEIHIPKDTP